MTNDRLRKLVFFSLFRHFDFFFENCARIILGKQLKYEVTETAEENFENNIIWMLLPDGRDGIQPAIISGLEKPATRKANIKDVKFFLFTRDNVKKAEVKQMEDDCLPVFKYFKSKRKTKVLIHGFGDSVQESLMVPVLKDAFLSRADYNVFAVDWSELSGKPWYLTASRNTAPVGEYVAQFIDHLTRSTDSRAEDFHLIGFSLGAHVAGLAGRNVKSGKIKYITGLDPAHVLFSKSGPDERLDSSHADVVEVIHTTGGYIGFNNPIGLRDFYPNGGKWPQPGCTVDFAAVCSHRRAYYYYSEAVEKDGHGFKAIPCESFKHYNNKECNSANNNNNTLELGDLNSNKMYSGQYFLSTNKDAPFAKEIVHDFVDELENLISR